MIITWLICFLLFSCHAHKIPSRVYKSPGVQLQKSVVTFQNYRLFCSSVLKKILENIICYNKGSPPEAQLKFCIMNKPREIRINGGHFSKTYTSYILVDKIEKKNPTSSFTWLTQQSNQICFSKLFPKSAPFCSVPLNKWLNYSSCIKYFYTWNNDLLPSIIVVSEK